MTKLKIKNNSFSPLSVFKSQTIIVIPNKHLTGVYHVAAQPISKYELLHKVAEVYGKAIEIVPNEQLVIDRSLNADRFNNMTGYIAPSWSELIKIMHTYQLEFKLNHV